jgi:hypothetical protein
MISKSKRVFILLISIFGIIAYIIFRNSVSLDICNSLDYACRTSLDSFEKAFLFFPFLLFFSLLTYKLPETIFRSWYRYVSVVAPIVLAISLFINLGLHHDPNGAWQNIFDSTALWALYILFSIGSIIAIWIGWRKTK